MGNKKRLCAVCGKDISHLNYTMVRVESLRETIKVCQNNSCSRRAMSKAWQEQYASDKAWNK